MSRLTQRARECIRLTWITWLLGPSALLLASVLTFLVWRERGDAMSGPMWYMVCLPPLPNLVSALLGLVVVCTPGPHRRRFEVRALLAYAGCIVAGLALGRVWRSAAIVCLCLANATTLVVLIAGMRRYLAPIRPPGRNAPR